MDFKQIIVPEEKTANNSSFRGINFEGIKTQNSDIPTFKEL